MSLNNYFKSHHIFWAVIFWVLALGTGYGFDALPDLGQPPYNAVDIVLYGTVLLLWLGSAFGFMWNVVMSIFYAFIKK